MDKTIKVLVVDDSAVMRELLSSIINDHPKLETIATAANPVIARKKILKLLPDVITLDIEMPEMDGVTFLQSLMKIHPMPVIMVSSLTKKGANVTLKALDLGAVDFVTKPDNRDQQSTDIFASEVCSKILAASEVNFQAVTKRVPATPVRRPLSRAGTGSGLVVIGASTGGPQVIQDILCSLPDNCPPVAIVQHMPPGFTLMYADRVNKLCAMSVSEARDNEVLKPGSALLAPGGFQMSIDRTGKTLTTRITDDPPVNQHRPAVDVLFRSVAQFSNHVPVMGIVLTGMGKDGAQGLLELRKSGSYTVAQDRKTSTIFGMPDQAIKLGAAENILPYHQMADEIMHWWASILEKQAKAVQQTP